MALGRRAVSPEDASAWVFNRMADVYDARPAYPVALLDALATLAGEPGSRIADVGAGIGHLALPLSARGYDVTAIEPAHAMLARLQERALAGCLPLRTVHAAAEALPLAAASFELVIVADALHFLDAELSALEIARVLAPQGALALVTCTLADTPFMRSVVELMQEAAPRRPRATRDAIAQVCALTQVSFGAQSSFHDRTTVDAETLERILRSISFIGPAMNPERFAAFRTRLHALPDAPVWARTLTLHTGRRAGATRSAE